MKKERENFINRIKVVDSENQKEADQWENIKLNGNESLMNKIFEGIIEIKSVLKSLQSQSNKMENDYLSFTEITEQYPISRETLYRLKNEDLLKVSRLKEKSKFLVARADIEKLIRNSRI